MSVFYFFLRSHRNYLYNGSWSNIRTNFYSNCFLGTPLKFFRFSLVRNFLIYRSLFKNTLGIQSFDDGDNSEEKTEVTGTIQKKKKLARVSVINEKNHEIVMEMVNAENYAKRKNMRLVPVDGARKDRMKYKLVKNDVVEDKNMQGKDFKKVMLREGIAAHDLEIKINQMLKLINKGFKVVSFIESSFGGEKLNNILHTLEKSKLNEFFVEKTKRSRGVQIIYKGKACSKEEKTE